MTDSLHNVSIVLDNGSGTIRAGFAGEDLPKCYFPSFVGRPKHLRVLAGALEGEVFIGQRAAADLRGLLKIRYPLEHGVVTDWDDMEKIWGYVYDEGLKTLSEEVSPVRGSRSHSASSFLTHTLHLPTSHVPWRLCATFMSFTPFPVRYTNTYIGSLSPSSLAPRPPYRASAQPPKQP